MGSGGEEAEVMELRAETERGVRPGGGVHGGMAVEMAESHPARHSALTTQHNLDRAPSSVPAQLADWVPLVTVSSVNSFDTSTNQLASEEPVHASSGQAYKGVLSN